jgi:hypothetical protein
MTRFSRPQRCTDARPPSRSFLLGAHGPCGGLHLDSAALRRSYRARENPGRNKIRVTESPQFQANAVRTE